MRPWNGIVLSLWWGMGLWLRSSIVFYYFGRNTISFVCSPVDFLYAAERGTRWPLSSFWVWAWNFNGWSPSSRAGGRGHHPYLCRVSVWCRAWNDMALSSSWRMGLEVSIRWSSFCAGKEPSADLSIRYLALHHCKKRAVLLPLYPCTFTHGWLWLLCTLTPKTFIV